MLAPLLLALVSQAVALDSLASGRCFVENQVCEANADNIIDTIGGVDLKECEALCSRTSGCEFITFFGPDSYPLYDYCFLFNDCSTQQDCDHCVTEAEVCFETCSSNLVGRLGEDNILDIQFDVESENECKLLCSENPACAVYTHFNSSDETFINYCFLTSQLQEPTHPCDNCKTGYPDCDSSPTSTTATTTTTTTTEVSCGFTIDSSPTVHQTYMFNETSKTDVFISAPNHCLLSIVAVGGGGGRASDGYGGGGSGYINYNNINMAGLVGETQFRVKVGAGGKRGRKGKDTTIDWDHWSLTDAFLRAYGGENANDTKGGAGNSGGGSGGEAYGDDGGKGGFDGSNGCCGGLGGEGVGLALDLQYYIQTFELSPGAGGKKYITWVGGGGGGGGGVLVNGEGPQDNYDSYKNNGQGYGGGGAADGAAGRGVVLMEIRAL